MSDALPNGLLKINGDRINPATDESAQASAGLVTQPYDYISAAYPSSSSEVYTFRSGGAAGSLVATVTLVFADSTKVSLISATKV